MLGTNRCLRMEDGIDTMAKTLVGDSFAGNAPRGLGAMNVVQMKRARMIDSVFRHFLVELGPSGPGTQECHAKPCRSSTCPSPTLAQGTEGDDGGRKGAMSAPCSHRVERAGGRALGGEDRKEAKKAWHSIRRSRAVSTHGIKPTTKGVWLGHSVANLPTSCIDDGEFSHLLSAILGCFVARRFQVSPGLASSCCNCSGSRSDSLVLAGHPPGKATSLDAEMRHRLLLLLHRTPLSPRLPFHKAGSGLVRTTVMH